MSPEAFAAVVRLMAKVDGGTVEVRDYYPEESERTPYRMATVVVLSPYADAPKRAAELTALACDIQGHIGIHTHFSFGELPAAEITVHLSRELAADERRETPTPGRPLSVSLETFGVVRS